MPSSLDKGQAFTVILADDDEDDYVLTKEALEISCPGTDFYWVKDGHELIEHLRQMLQTHSPQALVVLLDLNMPKKDGREALRDIKSDPQLCEIPVVVLSTSSSDEDIRASYRLGGSSFIRKPINFDRLVRQMNIFEKYWHEVVQLPVL